MVNYLSIRHLINLTESLNEMIVHRDRFIADGNDRKTVVAVNPTK